MVREAPERVHSISDLPRSRAQDQRDRMRSYTISMTIRTVCFLLAGLFVTVVPWQPGAWICIVAALVLPYPAVVIANNRDMRTQVAEREPVVPRMIAAPAGEDGGDEPEADAGSTVIRGEAREQGDGRPPSGQPTEATETTDVDEKREHGAA